LRDGTGIVFASAFPGYDQLVGKLAENGGDGEGHFDRRFLFQVLSMGHSQLAQFLGARGPNTAVNAACASTTQAIAMAEDWLRLGRCERVIVVGADDVTSENLLQWIGAGFMAAGAATTTAEVENAALPFDRRRHGMILGMGAVGLVLERGEDVRARGMVPIAELLATHLANSAFHGTRLDAAHIAREVKSLVDRAVSAAGVTHTQFAEKCVFLSHETYTPARGGSAAAEMASLPNAFGPAAAKVVIANTKGFTGHPMGAGVEDTVAIKSLQYQLVPPIPNLKERDPDLGELTLSTGGHYDVRFALRLAAGFGSQLALAAWKKIANGDERVGDPARHAAWLARVGGAPGRTVVENRQLRFVPDPEAARAAATAPIAEARPAARTVSGAEVLDRLIGVVAQKTGYSREEIDPGYELEADLGIDTVKQAEIFAEVRDAYGLERDDSFKLADYPTVEKLAGWLAERAAGAAGASPSAAPAAPAASTAAPAAAPSGTSRVDRDEVLRRLVGVVAAKTGYDVAEIDPAYELEADLGIDTVKQAEIFGEVRDAYGLERDDSFKLADYPTVAKLAGWLADKAAASSSPAAAPASPALAPPAPAAPPSPAVAPAAAKVSAEAARAAPALPAGPVAGHAEVLARLVEVVAARTGYEPSEIDPNYELEADLGIDTVKQAEIFGEVRDAYALERDDSFRLADYPTVDKLAGWLASRVAAKAGGDAAAPVAEAPSAPPPVVEAVPAEVAPVAVAPVPDEPDEIVEPPRLPHELPADFRVRRVVRVSHVKLPVSTLRGQVVWVLGGGELGETLREEIRVAGGQSVGDPDVIIDCGAPLLDLFAQAQRLDAKPPRQWLSILTPPADLLEARDNGARAGLCKALGREWKGCRARVVSVRANWPDLDAARAIVDELGEGDAANEVWIGPAERDVAALAVETVPTEGHWPEHPVAVLTGGTRGITAQVALELARRGPCTLILVARTLPGAAPLDEERERPLIRKALEAAHSRVTPKMIEEKLKPMRVAEEARQNVEAMIALGATVELHTLDLANPAAVRLTVAELRMRHPRIDLVIHGAGVEESRLLTDKDEAAFRRVFDGKAEGGLVLAEGLDPSTFFVSMGSIAGRFGNAGQVDYSAANEAMAQVCLARPRSLHVAWTAWAGVGMAVRGGMESLLTSRGVELLPPEAGARLLCDLVAAGVGGELVVAGRLGDFQSPSIHPLLDSVELIGDRAIGRRTLTLATDPWIVDHAIENVPVLPGVIGLEMMVGAALASEPRGRFVGFEDVTFAAPLKLHRDQPVDVVVTAEPDEEGAWRCTLSSTRTLKNGRTQSTRHFEARVQLAEMPLLPALPAAWFPEERVSQKDIYRRFFHGPRFQVLRAADAVTVQGLLAEAVVEHGGIAEGLLSEPLVLEAAFQAAGLHRIALEGVMALPASIDAVELVRSAVEGESLQVVVHARSGSYDIDVDGPEGRIMRVRGFRMVEKGPLPPGDRLPVPEGGWPSAAIAASTEASELPAGDREKMEARGTAKRRADRVAGQLAALRAVSALQPEAPFAVERESGGRPVVVGGAPRLEVSITHTDGEALALAVRGARAGVDMESITSRPSSFVAEWFTDEERAWAHSDEEITVVWSVKEAVLKALGVGMALNPREVEVLGVTDGLATVRLSGGVHAAHAELGGAPMRIRVGMHSGRVVVTAVFAA
jgi:3-oxoacyl-(acyl-carrier-protein) synthase/NAD(P)-dependent dehydrogenase (short-subunit alcohol dehydrogenase family)/phosphopantetheinyl transferase/acyl carrier protein